MHIIQFIIPNSPAAYIDSMLITCATAKAAQVQYEVIEVPALPRSFYSASQATATIANVELKKLEVLAEMPGAFIIDADDVFTEMPVFDKIGKPYFDYIHPSDPTSGPARPSGGSIYCNGCCELFQPMVEQYKALMYYGAIRRKILWDVPGYEIDKRVHNHKLLTRGRKNG
jgi:hypothetical protein